MADKMRFGVFILCVLCAELGSHIYDFARKNPVTTIGGGVGGFFGGPWGATAGAGTGAIVDNQAKHLDPGPAICKLGVNIGKAFGW